jgi:hypothetical protein
MVHVPDMIHDSTAQFRLHRPQRQLTGCPFRPPTSLPPLGDIAGGLLPAAVGDRPPPLSPPPPPPDPLGDMGPYLALS